MSSLELSAIQSQESDLFYRENVQSRKSTGLRFTCILSQEPGDLYTSYTSFSFFSHSVLTVNIFILKEFASIWAQMQGKCCFLLFMEICVKNHLINLEIGLTLDKGKRLDSFLISNILKH